MTHIPFKVSLLRLVFLLLPVTVAAQEARLSDYVDPRIGRMRRVEQLLFQYICLFSGIR